MSARIAPPMPDAVQAVIAEYPADARAGVLRLRALIYEVAEEVPSAGEIEECLKWGQPAYLAKTGSTLRIGVHKKAGFALFAHCQTTIIAAYAQAFPGWDRIDGNRAMLFDSPEQIEPARLAKLIRYALTYHAQKEQV